MSLKSMKCVEPDRDSLFSLNKAPAFMKSTARVHGLANTNGPIASTVSSLSYSRLTCQLSTIPDSTKWRRVLRDRNVPVSVIWLAAWAGSIHSSSPVFEEEWINGEHNDGDTWSIRQQVVEQGKGNEEEVDVRFFQLFICFQLLTYVLTFFLVTQEDEPISYPCRRTQRSSTYN